MHFKIAKSAQSYFNNIMNLEGSHAAEDKNKFIQFDVYYCCALIGMAAGQIDEDTSELKDLVERYPVQYRDCKAQIAGLLVASEARRLGIDTQSPKLEQIMLQYLSNNDTLLSEDGIKTLNAYALKGYRLITDYPLFDKPMLGEQYAPQFGIHKAGNSAVLRLIAPKYLDWQIPFEEQIDVVEDHLRLVALLCETAKQIDRERLSAFYAVAAPEKLK